ncbi:MAG: sugar ABC transporter substrate-binding protein [Spirochaeta sp.]|jgi:multiple sugar transport system substrate-binding protein|nr:sugar ABC transporter substrate-binding protein [Spirochaeta sp.]
MRRLSILMALVLTGIVAMAFAGGAAEEEDGQRVLKIASWSIQEAGTQGYFEELAADFEAANPDVTIEWIGFPYGQLREQVLIQASAGDPPDVVQTARGWLSDFANSGFFQPMEGLVSNAYIEDIFPEIREDLRYEGTLYAVPWFYSPFVLFYNTDLFEEAGLDPASPPETYEEALQVASRLAELQDPDGNRVYGLGIATSSVPVSGASVFSFLMSFGGGVWDEDGNIIIDSEENLRALAYLQEIHQANLNTEGAYLKDLRNLFAIGRLGMYFDQLWGMSGVMAINENAMDYTAVRPPLGTASSPAQSTLEAHLMMIPADAAEPELAAQFIEFATARDKIREYLDVNPFLVARASLSDVPEQQTELLAPLASAAESIAAVPKHPRMTDVFLELTSLAQRVTVGGESPEEAVRAFRQWADREL